MTSKQSIPGRNVFLCNKLFVEHNFIQVDLFIVQFGFLFIHVCKTFSLAFFDTNVDEEMKLPTHSSEG